ncbi:MAG: S-layer homology domain-containing protein [Neglectibacter sp.]
MLPDGRLLDGNDQTVVTVLLPTAKPATGLNVEVPTSDRNHAARDTDKKGQITVPDASGSAGEIIGTDTGDEDKSNTVNVDVTDQDGKPVDGAEIGVDKDGAVSVTLPDDFTFDEDGPVTVTITDNQGEAKPGVSVTVEDGDGTTAAGETGKEGKVTLPAAYHFAYLVGYRDGTIGPNRNMTRGEAAAVFARVLSEARGDELEGLRRSRFPDVRRDAWYADYVAYLEKLGVVVGYPDGLFHAEATITREQFVAMSVRLDEWMELETYDSKRGSFPDVPGSHWAADYIQEATRNGWIVGYTDGLFHGGDCITRAEVATIVNRMLGRTADERFIRHHEDELTTFRDLQNPHYWAYYDLMEAANGHTIVTGAEDETWHEVR